MTTPNFARGLHARSIGTASFAVCVVIGNIISAVS